MLRKVCIFTDVNNNYYTINKKWDGRKLNYEVYFDRCKKFGEIYRAFAYGTQIGGTAIKFISCLHHIGFEPNYREIEAYKWFCWDVGIAVEIANQIIHKKCDIIIIGSTNITLIPVIVWAKAQGIRVIVIGCRINREIREACDQWIEISEDMLEKEVKKDAVTETAE